MSSFCGSTNIKSLFLSLIGGLEGGLFGRVGDVLVETSSVPLAVSLPICRSCSGLSSCHWEMESELARSEITLSSTLR